MQNGYKERSLYSYRDKLEDQMQRFYFWTEKSQPRLDLTRKYEPIQPFLFLCAIENIKAETVFDIGANVGYYSFVAARSPFVKEILSFEAEEASYKELIENVRINHLDHKVLCHNVAVSSAEGTVDFGVSSPLAGINSVLDTSMHRPDLFAESKTVTAWSLDKHFSISGRRLGIKIDVEGHEIAVLDGARDLLQGNECMIQVESYWKTQSRLSEYMEAIGYRKFFKICNDLYYSNMKLFENDKNIVELVEGALGMVVNSNLGKAPFDFKNNNYLDVTAQLKSNKINVHLSVIDSYIGNDVEYAFYFTVDGQRVHTEWYKPNESASFDLSKYSAKSTVSVTGFARSKSMPERKISKVSRVR